MIGYLNHTNYLSIFGITIKCVYKFYLINVRVKNYKYFRNVFLVEIVFIETKKSDSYKINIYFHSFITEPIIVFEVLHYYHCL